MSVRIWGRFFLVALAVWVPAFGAAGVTFSPEGGVHPSAVSVSMADATPGSVIRYTMDGSLPTGTSPAYAAPISVTSTAVLRAAAFVGGSLVGEVLTDTYLVNPNTALPIISFVMDPYDIDPHNNLAPLNPNPLANSPEQVYTAPVYWNSYYFTESAYQDYFGTTDDMGERPVTVAYWTREGTKGFQVDAGLAMHGGASRSNGTMKKSFKLYFRSSYGPSKLRYPILISTPVDSFNKLVFRANYNDGWAHSKYPYATDAQSTVACYFRDSLNRWLRRDMGDLAGHDDACSLYLNGEPWGLYNITERFDDSWFEDYTGNADWDLLEVSDVGATGNDYDALPHSADIPKEGSATEWQSFVESYVTNGTNTSPSGLTGDAYYQAVSDRIDIANYTNYMILNIWNGNRDWPHHNAYVARERVAGAKWIFLDWDTESAFGGGSSRDVTYNALEHGIWTNLRLTNLLRQLLGSPAYRTYFAQRMDVLLNTTLETAAVSGTIDGLAAYLRPGMPVEQVWQQIHDINTWEAAVLNMKNWNAARTDYVRAHVRDNALMTNVTGWAGVTINALPATGGRVTIQTITPNALPWSGTFFTGVPLVLQAAPEVGYRFDGWSDGDPSGPTRTITLSGTLSVTAEFALDGLAPGIVSAEFGRRDLIAVDFDRALDPITALDPSNYTVDNGVGQPVAASLKREDTRVVLEFAAPMQSGVAYTVTVSGLRDAVLNPPMAVPVTAQVQFQTPDISITEVMYNTNGTEDVEWIELYNTTDHSIDLSGWYITDDNAYPATGEGAAILPAGSVLQGGEHVVVDLWNDPNFALWQMPPTVRVIHADCPDPGSLSNGGDNIALYTAATGGTLVDGSLTVVYPDKATAGASLEKVDERFPWGTELSNRYNFEAAVVEIGFETGRNAENEVLCAYASPGRANGTQFSLYDPDADADGDGIPNGVEDANGNGVWEPELGETNWQNRDTDGDGVADNIELLFGFDPLNPENVPAVPVGAPIVVLMIALAFGLVGLARVRRGPRVGKMG